MRPYYLLIIILLSISTFFFFQDDNISGLANKENGPVEIATAILYGMLILSMLALMKTKWPWGKYLSIFTVLMLLFRELDFDKAFTTMGIFKSRFYVSPDVPLIEKAIALSITLLILTTIILLLKKYWKSLKNGFKSGHPIESGILTTFGLALVSKLILDGLPRKLNKIDVSYNQFIDRNHSILEEVLELGIPIALMMSLYFSIKKNTQ